MRWHLSLLLSLCAGVLCAAGCAKARHVQINGGTGTVAIPENTNTWPNYYRKQAEDLMRQKCPNGYEIVAEEEAVVGQTAHTDTRTESKGPPMLGFGGTESKPGKGETSSFAGITLPIGKSETKTTETTQYTAIKEWRIHYRAR